MAARGERKSSYPVFRVETWDRFLKLITSPTYLNWAFRGERDERWPLYSSLSRYLQNFGVCRDAWPVQESRIVRIFKRKAHQFLERPPDAWSNVMLAKVLFVAPNAPARSMLV